MRQGDEDWFSVVRWTIYALIAAEELGITRANVDAMKASGSAEVRRFLGIDMDLGRHLGLSADWTQRVIKQVGNYGELFERHLGLKIAAQARAAAQQPGQPRRPALRAGFPLIPLHRRGLACLGEGRGPERHFSTCSGVLDGSTPDNNNRDDI